MSELPVFETRYMQVVDLQENKLLMDRTAAVGVFGGVIAANPGLMLVGFVAGARSYQLGLEIKKEKKQFDKLDLDPLKDRRLLP